MDTTSSNVAKAAKNAPRDLLCRLYRDIGISAVAAALESSSLVIKDVPHKKYALQTGKAA